MTNHHNVTIEFHRAIRLERLRTSFMSLICGLLFLFALAAATHIPAYLSTADYTRLVGVIAFNLLVIAGWVVNIRHHLYLRRLAATQDV